MASHDLGDPHFWVVIDTDGLAVGTCTSEESAHEFADFMNRRGKMPGLRIVEYAPVHRVTGGEASK